MGALIWSRKSRREAPLSLSLSFTLLFSIRRAESAVEERYH